jgi:DNA-binding transcriptional ArsR family regulator
VPAAPPPKDPPKEGPREGLDFEGIATSMAALANPNRLRVLRQLLVPRTVGEVTLPPLRAGAGEERAISREGVRQHLDKLEELGLVLTRPGRRDSGPVVEYLVNHASLFAFAEEVRKLAQLRPEERWGFATQLGGARPQRLGPPGAKLVLVHGLAEGTAWPLVASGARPAAWRLGRDPGCEVPLDFDPYVSREHALVEASGAGFQVRDLPASRNGTSLNWAPLPRGGSHALEAGDVIGVGRTLLLFRT